MCVCESSEAAKACRQAGRPQHVVPWQLASQFRLPKIDAEIRGAGSRQATARLQVVTPPALQKKARPQANVCVEAQVAAAATPSSGCAAVDQDPPFRALGDAAAVLQASQPSRLEFVGRAAALHLIPPAAPAALHRRATRLVSPEPHRCSSSRDSQGALDWLLPPAPAAQHQQLWVHSRQFHRRRLRCHRALHSH